MNGNNPQNKQRIGDIALPYLILLGVLLLLTVRAQAKTPAFPTAEGCGKWATGGRGGEVVEVTTVSDDGVGNLAGSLRWAAKQHSGKPLTIVFKVSGVIDLKGVDLRIKRNDLTIAGQTAPGDGICIRGGEFNMGGSSNVIVRHLRFRTGAYTSTGKEINVASVRLENGGNYIFDHCSVAWSAEELADFCDGPNITVQWCIFSEALYNSVNSKGARSYGPVLGGSGASYHHNLIAHCVSRTPRFGVSTKVDVNSLVDYVNNVLYNFGRATACYGGENEMGSAGSVKINMVNNYYKQGPAYSGSAYFVRASYEIGAQGTAYSKWHLNGNYIQSSNSANNKLNSDNYSGLHFEEYTDQLSGVTINNLKSSRHTMPESIITETAANAFTSVLNKAGAFPRDAIDTRAVTEAKNGTASKHGTFNNNSVSGIIDKPEDAGGWPTYKTSNVPADSDKDGMPDAWETAHGLNPSNASDRNNKDLSTEGYTNLEMYLNELAGDFSSTTQKYTLTSNVAQGQGSVSPTSGSYTNGQSVTVSATPASGWLFDRWGGDLSGSTNPATVTMTANKTISAYFVQDTRNRYTITKQAAPGGSITQSPEGSSLLEGTSVTLTAVPNGGWTFSGWSGGHTGANTTYTIASLSNNVSVSASFMPLDKYTYQAENGVLKDAVLETKNAGFSGDAYVNISAVSGSCIEIPVFVDEAGEKTVLITYANGSGASRQFSVSVNGTQQIASLDFEATTDWTTWQPKQIKLTFPQGASTVTLATINGQDGPNIDKIVFDQTTAAVAHQVKRTESVLSYNHLKKTLSLENMESQNIQLNIFSLSGKKVFSLKINTGSRSGIVEIPLADINSGFYLIRLESNGLVKTEYMNLL